MAQLRTILLVACMGFASWLAYHFTPKALHPVGYQPEITLAQLMPNNFGDWRSDNGLSESVITPDVRASLARFYTDTLSRSYTNSKGDKVMLSLAFGADQGRAMQVHKPEICYANQGFKMTYAQKGMVDIGRVLVPAMRLVATQDQRIEPITYWIRSGDYVVRGWFEQNLARVKNGLLKGTNPDGVLVRVSTIDTDRARSYAIQDRFLKDLIGASTASARAMLLGDESLLPKAGSGQ
jgi:EpsI family protein